MSFVPTGNCEDIWHLVESCPEACKQIGKPINAFPDQPNFQAHGILEVPTAMIQAAMNSSWPKCEFQPCLREAKLWVDGSVLDTSNFWTRTLCCSIISEDETVVFAAGLRGPVGMLFQC